MQSGVRFSNREFSNFTHPLSPDNPISSDTYLRRKISLSLVGISLAIAYLVIITFTEARNPFTTIAGISKNPYLSFLVFVFTVQLFFSVVKFPFDYYADYVVERRFRLSNQTSVTWVFRKLKGALVGAVLGVIVLTVFYFFLINSPKLWWLLFAAFFFLFQILVAQLFPTLILPLFYKVKPLENHELHSRLRSLVERFGYNMSGVFSFDLSRETKKANAALTGLGKTRKIIISDTLLENFSDDEIEVVMSHELGHLVKHHMIKGIIVSAVVSLIGFYVIAQIYSAYAAGMHLPLYSLDVVPFLGLVVTLFGLMTMPLGNSLSRKIEHEADMFALATTGMKKEFAESMRKLGNLNMVPENPPAWIEKIFFSHPSIGARIRAAFPSGDFPAEKNAEKAAR